MSRLVLSRLKELDNIHGYATGCTAMIWFNHGSFKWVTVHIVRLIIHSCLLWSLLQFSGICRSRRCSSFGRSRLRDVNAFSRQIVYVVLWCAVYSSLHRYLNESVMNLWLLCLCVSVGVVVVTFAIVLVFHYNNKEAWKRFRTMKFLFLERMFTAN